MVMEAVVGVRRTRLLNWSQMEGVVSQLALGKEELSPFAGRTNTPGKYRLFSQFPDFYSAGADKESVISSHPLNESRFGLDKDYLKSQNSWLLILIVKLPAAFFGQLSPQDDNSFLKAIDVDRLLNRKQSVKPIISLEQ